MQQSEIEWSDLGENEESLNVELWYPRNPGRPNKIEISLWDVRAADNLTVSYDFDRDGWRIGMDRTHDRGQFMDVIEKDVEVAFVPAWNTAPTRSNSGQEN